MRHPNRHACPERQVGRREAWLTASPPFAVPSRPRMADGVPLALTKRKLFRALYGAMAARDPNFRLQFLAADQGDPVLEDRLLAAIVADDAAPAKRRSGDGPPGRASAGQPTSTGRKSLRSPDLAKTRARSTERRNRRAIRVARRRPSRHTPSTWRRAKPTLKGLGGCEMSSFRARCSAD
jgi:hypothetical protein